MSSMQRRGASGTSSLALVIRTYFANLLQADIRAEAARTAAVA